MHYFKLRMYVDMWVLQIGNVWCGGCILRGEIITQQLKVLKCVVEIIPKTWKNLWGGITIENNNNNKKN